MNAILLLLPFLKMGVKIKNFVYLEIYHLKKKQLLLTKITIGVNVIA